MREGTTAAINEGSTLSTGGSNPVSRGDRIKHLVDSLKKSAWSTQQPVMNLLNEQAKTTATSLSATTFWISNQIYVADASMELLQRLRMESSIAEIREEQILTMGGHFKAEHSDDAEPRTKIHAWGVGKIGAEVVWAKGIMGANVTIATIDTGVRASHEALRSNFQGDYGWFDPETKSGAPFDLSGHGTHVIGSIVGVNGVGVAPKANWMACRGCRSTTLCLESSLLACAQFVLCPTDPKGHNPKCSKAPRVVNNSWGAVQGAANFSAIIAAWQAAEIIPVFSIGNSGSFNSCGVVASPGDSSMVIGVGATRSNEFLLPQSSTGPSADGRIKPDIVAPGDRIYSAWWTRDNVYVIASGTSMASPHVAGAVALLLSAQPDLTYDQIWGALAISAAKDRSVVDNAAFHSSCGNISALMFPNNIFGYGRLDVDRAVQLLDAKA
ncbi:serine protease family S08A, putative [Phytophthora infestans T30-4]|uniref:subtilisin n=2 Tax=Phytophthora infestans TaxID=4787 RepID=D0MRG0_PHYIT|nr:serine protease family S08A, putative [Phytophthora infestans T30-4]EEY58079.1 serine protease family S08A, putative [Phytophthora infestans T30-4]|eukprot:XP_002909265.1 serine protease family S08A, putative [Phytophthora infestans T30-4]